MNALILTGLLAASPSLEVATASSTRAPLEVGMASVPQLGLVSVDGRVGLANWFALELGGWNVFARDTGAFLRGGWAGGSVTALQTDALTMQVGLKVFGAQPDVGVSAVAGLSGRVETTIHVFDRFLVKPEFEVGWLGALTHARFSNELAMAFGEWRLGASGGAQLWAVGGAITVAPAAALTVGLRHDFGPVALDVSGVLGVANDASYLTHSPVLQAPQSALGFQAGLRVAFIATSR